jgi:hypothetical protein
LPVLALFGRWELAHPRALLLNATQVDILATKSGYTSNRRVRMLNYSVSMKILAMDRCVGRFSFDRLSLSWSQEINSSTKYVDVIECKMHHDTDMWRSDRMTSFVCTDINAIPLPEKGIDIFRNKALLIIKTDGPH